MTKNYQESLWTEMADEANAAAERVCDPDLRFHVRLVAARYNGLAKREEQRRISAPDGNGEFGSAM